MIIRIFAATAVFLMSTSAAADDLTFERVFASPSLGGPAPRKVKLSPDGRLATLLKPRPGDKARHDLWVIDPATGAERMLVDSEVFGGGALSEDERMARERARIAGLTGIVDYRWAPDGQSLLVPVDGDLFRADLDGKVTRLTETEDTERLARISGKGRYVSWVGADGLYVLDSQTGERRRVTPDAAEAVRWGVAEFIAQEEMGRDDGYWWSPTDERVAVARVDERGVGIVTRNAIGAEGTTTSDQRYPVTGSANAIVDLFLMDPDGGNRVAVDLGVDDDIYLARVDWSPDGSALYVQRQSRDQQRLDMLRVDPATGVSEIVFTETGAPWLNLDDDLRILTNGDLIWTSERDGFSHIYRFRDGEWTQLTSGDWVVSGIAAVDETAGHVLFTGNRDDPTEMHLYRVPLAGDEVVQLTPTGWSHSVKVDDSSTRAVVTRSSRNQPPQTYLADAANPVPSAGVWIEENALDETHAYAPHLDSHLTARTGTLPAADGTALHYEMLVPPHEPGARLPVFLWTYGGPGVQFVANQWRRMPTKQTIAGQGYIVFSMDNRGATNRGTAFEAPIDRAMGGVEVEDQLAAAAWLKEQSFVDSDRIAVFGWSYGGFMSLKLLQDAPGTFAAGISVAPVTDWRLYDTHYTERYLGKPQDDQAVYDRSGALQNAEAIADPLLLIHGMADDNVILDNSVQLMAR
ncbi:MAG: DPP IV N-terminal domain-containing protein, partial [Pacificimonas sp.]